MTASLTDPIQGTHPMWCKDIARGHAFFGALAYAEKSGRADAYAYAESIRESLPRCDCQEDAEIAVAHDLSKQVRSFDH